MRFKPFGGESQNFPQQIVVCGVAGTKIEGQSTSWNEKSNNYYTSDQHNKHQTIPAGVYLNTFPRSFSICLQRNFNRYANVVNTHWSERINNMNSSKLEVNNYGKPV